MKKQIIAIAVSAASAAALTFGSVAPATAVVPAVGSLSEAVCGGLTGILTTVGGVLSTSDTAVTSTGEALATKKAALTTAVNDLVTAVVAHIGAASAGSTSAVTGTAMNEKLADFSAKYIDAYNALFANFDAQQKAYAASLNNNYISGVQAGLCV